MKLYSLLWIFLFIGIVIPLQTIAVSNTEFWWHGDNTIQPTIVTSLDPLETYTLVFTQDATFSYTNITFSHGDDSHWLYWNESGYRTNLWNIDVNASLIDPSYRHQKLIFTVDRLSQAGTWDVSITLDSETEFLTIYINELTTYEVFNELNDWGSYDIGGEWVSNILRINVVSNNNWTLIVSGTLWTNGSYVLNDYALNDTYPLQYEGDRSENITVSMELFLESVAQGTFRQTTSIVVDFGVYDIDQQITIGSSTPIDPYFNITGNVKVTGYTTYDIDVLGGHPIIFEIANDTNFYLLDHLELATSDDNGYFFALLIANFTQWIRATVQFEGETYYSVAFMVQEIDLEYDLSVHIPKSLGDIGNTFIEDYGAVTVVSTVSVIGIVFVIGRRFAGSPI